MTMKLSNSAAGAMLSALCVLANGGSLKIYTGSAPSNVEDSATGTLLVTLPLSSTAFGSPSSASGTDAVATANAISSATCGNSGTAGYFRVVNSSGVAIYQGSVNTSGADLNLGSISLSSGQSVTISSLTLTKSL